MKKRLAYLLFFAMLFSVIGLNYFALYAVDTMKNSIKREINVKDLRKKPSGLVPLNASAADSDADQKAQEERALQDGSTSENTDQEFSAEDEENGSVVASTGRLTASNGVVYFDGHRETYYSQRVLPGNGLSIPGRHVASDGTIRDENDYICVASSDLPKGTVVETSLGTGKVYDSGCASGTIDIYTDW